MITKPLVAVPGQSHGVHPELLVDRLLERGGVRGRGRHRGTGAVGDLVQQLLEPVGEHHHLLLLQCDRDRPGLVGCLQVERAVTGRADGAGDEPAWAVEDKELA